MPSICSFWFLRKLPRFGFLGNRSLSWRNEFGLISCFTYLSYHFVTESHSLLRREMCWCAGIVLIYLIGISMKTAARTLNANRTEMGCRTDLSTYCLCNPKRVTSAALNMSFLSIKWKAGGEDSRPTCLTELLTGVPSVRVTGKRINMNSPDGTLDPEQANMNTLRFLFLFF